MQKRRPTKRYHDAFKMLYGEQIELVGATQVPPKVRSSHHGQKNRLESNVPKEFQEQIVAATWLTRKNVLFYHVPNGGFRDYREAAKFKRMGVQAGVPDLCIPIPKKGFHGLYIELKRIKGGSVSDSQSFWMDALRKQGYDVFVARGANELIDYVQKYLGD